MRQNNILKLMIWMV